MPGKLKWIASGTDVVVGVNSDDDIFYREGITSDNPTGTKWHKVEGKLMNIDIEEGEVVGTNSANNIFRFLHVHSPQSSSKVFTFLVNAVQQSAVKILKQSSSHVKLRICYCVHKTIYSDVGWSDPLPQYPTVRVRVEVTHVSGRKGPGFSCQLVGGTN